MAEIRKLAEEIVNSICSTVSGYTCEMDRKTVIESRIVKIEAVIAAHFQPAPSGNHEYYSGVGLCSRHIGGPHKIESGCVNWKPEAASAPAEWPSADEALRKFESDMGRKMSPEESNAYIYGFTDGQAARPSGPSAEPMIDSFINQAVKDQEEMDDWLTHQVHRGEGVVQLGLTENGDVGVWLPGTVYEANCDGVGDSALEAIEDAQKKSVRATSSTHAAAKESE